MCEAYQGSDSFAVALRDADNRPGRAHRRIIAANGTLWTKVEQPWRGKPRDGPDIAPDGTARPGLVGDGRPSGEFFELFYDGRDPLPVGGVYPQGPLGPLDVSGRWVHSGDGKRPWFLGGGRQRSRSAGSPGRRWPGCGGRGWCVWGVESGGVCARFWFRGGW